MLETLCGNLNMLDFTRQSKHPLTMIFWNMLQVINQSTEILLHLQRSADSKTGKLYF